MKAASRQLILLLVIVLLSAGCSMDPLFPQPAPTSVANPAYLATMRRIRLDRYLGIEPEREQALGNSGWVQYHYDQADCRCIDGGPFHVLARPGRPDGDESAEDKVSKYTLFWLADGGACWPGHETCTTRAELAQSMHFGLAAQVPGNPLRKWNVISVPYCDGSLHAGDNDADYDGDGRVDHYHHGLKTTSAAVALMKDLFPESTKVLIAGCGAGGYGTIVATPLIRLQFPAARLYIWNENGPEFYEPRDPEVIETVVETWNLDSYLPDDCSYCRTGPVNLYTRLLTRDPWLKVGLLSSYQDLADQNRFLAATDALQHESDGDFKYYLAWADSPWAESPWTDSPWRDASCVDNYSRSASCIPIADWVMAMVSDNAKWGDVTELPFGPP